MTKHMVNKNAKCPFYLHEDSQVIYCEGVQDDSVIHLAFANKTDAKAFKQKYCRDRYEICSIERMLEDVQEEK